MFKIPDRRRIYLMRHGEAAYVGEDGTVTDDPRNVSLTREGRRQAQIQGQMLAEVGFDAAFSSTLPRTRETAQLVLEQSRVASTLVATPVDELVEISGHGGAMEAAIKQYGSPSAWLEQVANPWANAEQSDARFLGGERFDDFRKRVVPAWEQIVADTSWRTCLVVLHGAVNRALFNHIIDIPWKARVCIEQDNCCVNIIDVDAESKESEPRYLIRGINITAYNLTKSDIMLTSMEHTAQRIGQVMGDSVDHG